MQRILEGVIKFQKNVFPAEQKLFRSLSNQQNPEYLLLTCSDSRIVPHLITQTDPGELFTCRNAGNIAPAYGEPGGGVSATIEYAVAVLNVKSVIVCGHYDCGAMKALFHPEKTAPYRAVSAWLHHAEVAKAIVLENHPTYDGQQLLNACVEQNVLAQLANLRTHPFVAARERKGTLTLSGWVYRIETGEVFVYDEATKQFMTAAECLHNCSFRPAAVQEEVARV